MVTPRGPGSFQRPQGPVPPRGPGSFERPTSFPPGGRGIFPEPPPFEPARGPQPSGGLLEQTRQFTKQISRPDPQYWMNYVKNFFGSDVEGMQAFLESGQSLTEFAQGMRFGPGTAESLGLQYGVGYTPEQIAPWLNKLDAYGRFYYDERTKMRTLPYWIRGAQLGITPQEYMDRHTKIDQMGLKWREQVAEWQAAELQTARLAPMGRVDALKMPPMPEKPKLSKLDQYLFGFSSEAPPGFISLKMAGKPPSGISGLGGGPPVPAPPKRKPQEQARDWFRDQYPNVAKEIELEKPKMPSGRFAPRVTTLRF